MNMEERIVQINYQKGRNSGEIKAKREIRTITIIAVFTMKN